MVPPVGPLALLPPDQMLPNLLGQPFCSMCNLLVIERPRWLLFFLANRYEGKEAVDHYWTLLEVERGTEITVDRGGNSWVRGSQVGYSSPRARYGIGRNRSTMRQQRTYTLLRYCSWKVSYNPAASGAFGFCGKKIGCDLWCDDSFRLWRAFRF